MLNEAKVALRINSNVYDGEIARLILAGVADLGIVDVHAAGISLTISSANGVETVTDSSTITDQLLIRAIITYVKLHFSAPTSGPALEYITKSYYEQKAQLITATGYGLTEV